MPFPQRILSALEVYDTEKGFFRRLFGDQAAIRNVRKLDEAEQTNFLKIYQRFIENLPKPTQASYKVYQALLTHLNTSLPEVIDKLHAAKLLNPKNLEIVIQLKEDDFQLLDNLLFQLNNKQLLNRDNFAAISKFFETIEENTRIKLSSLANAVNTLYKTDLNQAYLNFMLENPDNARNRASALTALHSTSLLTTDNLNQLNHPNHFLLSDDAHTILWTQFKRYLDKLLIDQTNQTILDKIIKLAKQENPKDKIKDYMDQLNSQAATTGPQYPVKSKFSTAPRGRSQEQLLTSSEFNYSFQKSGTI